MQDVLNYYQSGIQVDQVQLQKVDPPSQVIDAFRDVQAARADKERLQNEAFAYQNKIIPEARGEAERILQGAKGYQQEAVAEAVGQTSRFLKVYDEYKKAPDVTRRRLYLETMERVLSGANKVILDNKAGTSGVIPFLQVDPQQQQVRPKGVN
jgi:membrane protease subunit HflK